MWIKQHSRVNLIFSFSANFPCTDNKLNSINSIMDITYSRTGAGNSNCNLDYKALNFLKKWKIVFFPVLVPLLPVQLQAVLTPPCCQCCSTFIASLVASCTYSSLLPVLQYLYCQFSCQLYFLLPAASAGVPLLPVQLLAVLAPPCCQCSSTFIASLVASCTCSSLLPVLQYLYCQFSCYLYQLLPAASALVPLLPVQLLVVLTTPCCQCSSTFIASLVASCTFSSLLPVLEYLY